MFSIMAVTYRSADGPRNREILGLCQLGILTVVNIAHLKIYFNFVVQQRVAELPSLQFNWNIEGRGDRLQRRKTAQSLLSPFLGIPKNLFPDRDYD